MKSTIKVKSDYNVSGESSIKEIYDLENKKSQPLISINDVESNTNEQEPVIVRRKDGQEIMRAEIEGQPLTGKWELVGYALYYFANHSSVPYAYTPTAFQNLLNQAG